MPLFGDCQGLDHRHIDLAPVARPDLAGEHRQVIVLEEDAPLVDLPAHGAVAHIGAAPGDDTGLGEAAVDLVAGRGAGEQVDLELLAFPGPPYQLLWNEFGIAGGEAGDEEVGAVLDMLRRRPGVADLVEQWLVMYSFFHFQWFDVVMGVWLNPDAAIPSGRIYSSHSSARV